MTDFGVPPSPLQPRRHLYMAPFRPRRWDRKASLHKIRSQRWCGFSSWVMSPRCPYRGNCSLEDCRTSHLLFPENTFPLILVGQGQAGSKQDGQEWNRRRPKPAGGAHQDSDWRRCSWLIMHSSPKFPLARSKRRKDLRNSGDILSPVRKHQTEEPDWKLTD